MITALSACILSHNPWLGYVRLQVDIKQYTFKWWCACGCDDRNWEWIPAINSTTWEKCFWIFVLASGIEIRRVTAGRWIMGEWEKIWECERRMTVHDVVVWDESVISRRCSKESLKFRSPSCVRRSVYWSWSMPSSLLVNLRWTALTEQISMPWVGDHTGETYSSRSQTYVLYAKIRLLVSRDKKER